MSEVNTKVDKSVIDAKVQLLNNLSSAHEQGLVNDVTFICNDGVKISSNKSVLSVRSSYFYSMFFGGFKDTVEEEVEFKSCTSVVLKHILDYVWRGTIDLKSVSVEVLLNLLETSRMFCFETLKKGIEEYLIYNINLSTLSNVELLEALDFAILNKFDALLQSLLLNINKILDLVAKCPRFQKLTEPSILSIMTFASHTSLQSVKFEAFLVWIEDENDLTESSKYEMLKAFDLKKFDKSYLLSKVRRTGYFTDEAIFDVLEEQVAESQEKYHHTESTLNDTLKDMREKNQRIQILETNASHHREDKVKSDREIKRLKTRLTEVESSLGKMKKWNNVNMNKFKKMNIVSIPSLTHHAQSFTARFGFCFNGLCYAFEKIESINNIQFDVIREFPSVKLFSYSIESSVDKLNWTKIDNFNDCKGRQNVYFPMQDMLYLCIKLTNGFHVMQDTVVFILDTKSGERRNKTS